MNILFTILAAGLTNSATVDPRYQECVDLVSEDARASRTAAERWVTDGGGPKAQHCLAVAELAAGLPKRAASRLQSLGENATVGPPEIRSKLYAQAAEAWLQANASEEAEAALDNAFKLTPGAGELYLVAAKLHAMREEPIQVINAIDEAEATGLGSVMGFVLRGRAHLETNDKEAAAQDVVRALSIDPTSIQALLLRGELQQLGVNIDVDYGDAL